MKIKTYVISLKKAEDRRMHLQKEIADFTFMDVEWVEAVDGKFLSQADTNRLFDVRQFACRYNRLPYPGEVGCTLSHRECFRRLVESDNDIALILEDDVLFPDHANVENVINKSVQFLIGKKAGVLTLSSHRVSSTKGNSFVANFEVYRVWFAYGTNAYLIHRNSAKKLLKDAPASILADDYQYMNMKGIAVYGIQPFLSIGLSNEGSFSFISETVRNEQKRFPGKDILLRYLLSRFIRGGIRRFMLFMNIMSVKDEKK